MTNTTARRTVAQAHGRIDAIETKVDQILALLEAQAPAKSSARKAPAKKAPAKARKAPVAKAPAKGAQTRETLSRKDWNKTLTTLAKTQPKGSGAYKAVLDAWDTVSEARDAGMTPVEALALVIG